MTPEDRAAGVPDRELQKARKDGRAVNERWHLRKDGSRFWSSGVMMRIERGDDSGYLNIFRDRTEQRRAQEHQALLIKELNHRVKNTLATVQSLAAQSLQAQDAGGWKSFEARLLALSHAHDLLTHTNWEGAPLRDLLTQELEPYRSGGGARLRADGPDIILEPKVAIMLTMAIHELATNAAKYGALSKAGGEVWVSWRLEPGSPSLLKLDWTETGGPPVTPRVRKGFGSRLIERGLALELDGRARLEFPRKASTAASRYRYPAGGLSDVGKRARRDQAASPLRVLLVEDEAMVAMLLEDALSDLGHQVVGPVAKLDKAVAMARQESFDIGILDVNFAGQEVYPVAEILAARGIPFVFVTGYGESALRPPYTGRPVLPKPFRIDQISTILAHAAKKTPA